MIPISILDLSPIPEGGNASQALANSHGSPNAPESPDASGEQIHAAPYG